MNLTEIVQKNKEALKIIYASNNIAQEVNEATLGMLLVSNDKVASEVSALLSSPPESFESVEGKDKEKAKEVAKVVLDTIMDVCWPIDAAVPTLALVRRGA